MATLTISRTLLVEAVAAVEGGRRVCEEIAKLAKAPALYLPSPLC